MSQHNEIREVEMSIEAAKEMVARGEMARKLADNPDFKKIVLDGYFVDEAARLTHLFSDPMMDEAQRKMIERDLIGIGAFKRYLKNAVQFGEIAAREISDAEIELDELRAEDDE